MKYCLGLVLLFVIQLSSAQIRGNKKIITQEFQLENIRNIVVDLYAEVEVDCAMKEGIRITVDENLLELIEKSIDDGRLVLDQKEWIQPSQPIKIVIGAPDLERVEQSTHDITIVKNIETDEFMAMAIIGEIKLEGKVNKLYVSGELGEIDAKSVDAKTVDINLWGWGRIDIGAPEEINGLVKANGYLYYDDNNTRVKVRTTKGGKIINRKNFDPQSNPKTRYIKVRIKNNSKERLQAYVIGPKPDGKKFSYGFPLNPGQIKKENWTIGTKVYRQTKLGTRKKLAEIKPEDEGKVVSLF